MEKSIVLVLDKLDEVIRVAGGKIEGFYPYVFKEQIIYGSISICALLLFTSLLCYVIRQVCKKGGINKIGEDLAIALSILSVFSLVAFLVAITMGLPRFLNPDYYAVKEIINMVEGLIPR